MIVAGCVIMNERGKRRTSCRWLVHEWLLCRFRLGTIYTILPELRTDFQEVYKKYLRTHAESLLKVMTSLISKQETRPRETIPAFEILSMTLI